MKSRPCVAIVMAPATLFAILAQVALTAQGSIVSAIAAVDATIVNTAVQHTDSEVSQQLAVRQYLSQFGGQLVQP